jgi:uncharacterized repeat protein (TIGR01451 family)
VRLRKRSIALSSALSMLGLGVSALVVGESAGATSALAPAVTHPVAAGVSAPVRTLAPALHLLDPVPDSLENETSLHVFRTGQPAGVDPVLQTSSPTAPAPSTTTNFEGISVDESSSDGIFIGAPPDTNGDVGPNHYVQAVNTTFAIWDTSGTQLVAPTPLNELWLSAPNAAEFNCTAQSRGDPIVQYDPLADRWMISQFNFPGIGVAPPPYDECIALSTTPDPTGSYYLYDFNYSFALMNDYPHFGVWPDGYYMTVNQFAGGQLFASAGACVFEREKMLVGDAGARQICYDESAFDTGDPDVFLYGGQLPTDLDGVGYGASFEGEPPAGSPNYVMQLLDSGTPGEDKLLAFPFHVDWTDPEQSTFGGTDNQPIEIPVADFDSDLCGGDRLCVPAKNGEGMDAMADRLMYRLAYRNLGDRESLVVTHTVDVGDSQDHAGLRWYEITDPGGVPVVRQQGTYAPDGEHRWMGSAAMDKTGGIALGYSLSSDTRFPAIAVTGRGQNDPLGAMTYAERLVYQGGGSQVDTEGRWGDYSSLSVAPDGCTMWFTTEYYPTTTDFGWHTRIASFALPSCSDQTGADMSTSSSGPATALMGDTGRYTVVVSNSGPQSSSGTTLTADLPKGVTVTGVGATSGTCTITKQKDVVCDLGSLGSGSRSTVTLAVKFGVRGTMTTAVDVASTAPDDPNPANNRSSLTTVVAR